MVELQCCNHSSVVKGCNSFHLTHLCSPGVDYIWSWCQYTVHHHRWSHQFCSLKASLSDCMVLLCWQLYEDIVKTAWFIRSHHHSEPTTDSSPVWMNDKMSRSRPWLPSLWTLQTAPTSQPLDCSWSQLSHIPWTSADSFLWLVCSKHRGESSPTAPACSGKLASHSDTRSALGQLEQWIKDSENLFLLTFIDCTVPLNPPIWISQSPDPTFRWLKLRGVWKGYC